MQFIDFFNNPNVGLFFYTTDKVTIIPNATPGKVKKIIKNELKTKIIECDVYESSVNNIFLTGNEEYLFVPSMITETEMASLQKSNLKVKVLDTKLNALGNNLVFKGDNVLVNPKIESTIIEELEELGFNVFKATIAEVNTIGANIVIFGGTALINPDVKPEELKIVQKTLGVKCVKGTVNNKGKIVKSGVVSNKHGVLVSKLMTGPEMMNLEDLWKNGYKKK